MNAHQEVLVTKGKLDTAKAILQSDIYERLNRFKQETGVSVTGIDITTTEARTVGGGRYCVVTYCDIKLERVL